MCGGGYTQGCPPVAMGHWRGVGCQGKVPATPALIMKSDRGPWPWAFFAGDAGTRRVPGAPTKSVQKIFVYLSTLGTTKLEGYPGVS